jgi:hypothetical protein
MVLVMSAIVGFGLVLQQTPFAVMLQPAPPEVILNPPLLAEELVTEDGKVVESDGVPVQFARVVNV